MAAVNLHRQFLVIGSSPIQRKRFAASAVQHARYLGWRGTDFLVGFEDSVVGVLFKGSNSRDALAVAATGSILERFVTARAVSHHYADAIIAYDWYGCFPYYKDIENLVLKACEECYSDISFLAAVSCVPLEEIRSEERSWLEERNIQIIDMAASPRSFGNLIMKG